LGGFKKKIFAVENKLLCLWLILFFMNRKSGTFLGGGGGGLL